MHEHVPYTAQSWKDSFTQYQSSIHRTPVCCRDCVLPCVRRAHAHERRGNEHTLTFAHAHTPAQGSTRKLPDLALDTVKKMREIYVITSAFALTSVRASFHVLVYANYLLMPVSRPVDYGPCNTSSRLSFIDALLSYGTAAR